MYKNISIIIFVWAIYSGAQASDVKCVPEPKGEIYLSENFTYEVAGTGRLYLHAAPSEKCLDKNLFVVPGDTLFAYKEYGSKSEWSDVTFISKSGKEYYGWVLTKRLMFMGASGPHMTPDKVKYYTDAAKAAKAGKLGSPLGD